MKKILFTAFNLIMLTAMGLALYLAFASIFVGCRPVDVNEAESNPRRAGVEQVLDKWDFNAYVLTVDGVDYVVVRDTSGLAICPKVVEAK